ncbi:protein of unknown function [Candidatus Methylomirabilis oxygeniifera]|uniref:Uncharacterized protein n=1 Tax=Methylomirabilis oxygeniifera TaxID=671143 RepID=D5ML26_METO1|nr:protein of unknown function [Candidatus Methylomirabilis oxyfera]
MMRDRLGLNSPVCFTEQANSQARQAVHRSGMMLRTFAIPTSVYAERVKTFFI